MKDLDIAFWKKEAEDAQDAAKLLGDTLQLVIKQNKEERARAEAADGHADQLRTVAKELLGMICVEREDWPDEGWPSGWLDAVKEAREAIDPERRRRSMALGIAKIQVLCSSNPSCGAGPQEFFLGGVSMEMARGYCGILDGTSPMFVSPPLEDPRSRIGRCMNCGQPFTAKVIEFAEASQATH